MDGIYLQKPDAANYVCSIMRPEKKIQVGLKWSSFSWATFPRFICTSEPVTVRFCPLAGQRTKPQVLQAEQTHSLQTQIQTDRHDEAIERSNSTMWDIWVELAFRLTELIFNLFKHFSNTHHFSQADSNSTFQSHFTTNTLVIFHYKLGSYRRLPVMQHLNNE